ncbi:MAG TPA: TlpA disulfide reductase family protein [Acidimicrobiales bacterium]|nr:TlpA disulfide reductase family protein [Acidimicrobiales bacterium]
MADSPELDAGGTAATAEPAGADPSPGGRRRTLDRRTVAIGAVLGVIAAILTVLIASAFTSDDDAGKGMVLTDPSSIDTNKLLGLPVDLPDGDTTTLTSFLDDGPTVINFWASTCPPCVAEMPLLEEVSGDNPDVAFVGVATLDKVDDAKKLAKQTGITYPWVLDDTGETAYEADGTTLPTTILLNADAEVIDSHVGEFHSADELQAFIDQAG